MNTPGKITTSIAAAVIAAAAAVILCTFLLRHHRYADSLSALCSALLFLLITEIDEINNVKPSSYIVSGEASLCFAILVVLLFFDISVPLIVPAAVFTVIHLSVKSFRNGQKAFNGIIVTLVTVVLSVTAYYKFTIKSPLIYAAGFTGFSGLITALSGVILCAVILFRQKSDHRAGSHGCLLSVSCAGFILSVIRNLSVFMMFTVNGFAAPPALMSDRGFLRRGIMFCIAFAFFSGLALSVSGGRMVYWYCGISLLVCVTVYGIDIKRKASHALCKRTFIFEERENNS